jgi:hypothetical protein
VNEVPDDGVGADVFGEHALAEELDDEVPERVDAFVRRPLEAQPAVGVVVAAGLQPVGEQGPDVAPDVEGEAERALLREVT